MPECSYCDASFDDEESLLSHMGEAHEGELGRVDQRRVEDAQGESGGGLPTGPIILVGVIGFALALVAFVIVGMGGGGGLGAPGSTHEHGSIEMEVLGERVDFSQPEYQRPREVPRFHFENREGDVYHVHATGVNLSWAMNTLDIGLTEDSVTFDGTTYRDTDPQYDVSVTVDGEPVDPETHVLNGVSEVAAARQGEGDSVRIVVNEANATG